MNSTRLDISQTITTVPEENVAVPAPPTGLSNATTEHLRRAFAREYELREMLVQRLLWQHQRIPSKEGRLSSGTLRVKRL